jgi:hypothetical protein
MISVDPSQQDAPPYFNEPIHQYMVIAFWTHNNVTPINSMVDPYPFLFKTRTSPKKSALPRPKAFKLRKIASSSK